MSEGITEIKLQELIQSKVLVDIAETIILLALKEGASDIHI